MWERQVNVGPTGVWALTSGFVHPLGYWEYLNAESSQAYQAYETDQFNINMHLTSIFDKPLQELLQVDTDYLPCWLCSNKERVESQRACLQCQSDVARDFFKPRRKLNCTLQWLPPGNSTFYLPLSPNVLEHTCSLAYNLFFLLKFPSLSRQERGFLLELLSLAVEDSFTSNVDMTTPLTLRGEEDSLEDSFDHDYTSISIMRCLLCVFASIV